MKPRIVLPLVAAGSLGLAQVLGPHDPHVVELPIQEMPQVVGMLATNIISTATANVQMVTNSTWTR
jgi:hypothetical protein